MLSNVSSLLLQRKRLLIVTVCLASVLLLAVSPAFADDVYFTGELTTDDLVWDYDGVGPYYLDSFSFTVTESGDYRIGLVQGNFDTWIQVYEGGFDSENPDANVIGINDDGGQGLLSKLHEQLSDDSCYVLVISSYSSFDTGSYSVGIDGPGQVESAQCRFNAVAGNLLDGRINNGYDIDVAAPIAIYCEQDDGPGFDIYTINSQTGDGTLAVRVTLDQINDVGIPTDANAPLWSEGGLWLFRLTTGEFQLNTANFDGKPYSISWWGCPSSGVTHLVR
jgi:hypothetical protein